MYILKNTILYSVFTVFFFLNQPNFQYHVLKYIVWNSSFLPPGGAEVQFRYAGTSQDYQGSLFVKESTRDVNQRPSKELIICRFKAKT